MLNEHCNRLLFVIWIFIFGYFWHWNTKKILKFSTETSRKLIHILIGFTWIILYRYLRNTIHFIIIPLSFIIINALSYKFKIFKMFERETNEKNHYGTIYYAIAMTIMATLSFFNEQLLLPYGLSVFVLSFGDGAAALFGTAIKKHNPKITKEKSLIGTLACIIFSGLGIILFEQILNINISILYVALIAVITGILELVGYGLDNFSVTLGVMLISYFVIN